MLYPKTRLDTVYCIQKIKIYILGQASSYYLLCVLVSAVMKTAE